MTYTNLTVSTVDIPARHAGQRVGSEPPGTVNNEKLIHTTHIVTSRVSCLPGPVGEIGAVGQRVRVFGAQDPLADQPPRRALGRGPQPHPRRPGSRATARPSPDGAVG